jgi:hypothetical protein
VPHWHAPADEQLFASVSLQATQAVAPLPHVSSDGILHVAPVQHPLVQSVAHPEQTPVPSHV